MLDLDYTSLPEALRGPVQCNVEAIVPDCKLWCDCPVNNWGHLRSAIVPLLDTTVQNTVIDTADGLDWPDDLTQWWNKAFFRNVTKQTRTYLGTVETVETVRDTTRKPWTGFVERAFAAIVKHYRG